MAIYTQAEADALKAAIVTGVLSVTYSGPPSRTVTYQSLDAMRALHAAMLRDLSAQAGNLGYRVAGTKKGFDE